MSSSPTAVERTAIRTGWYAALRSADSPNSEVVEQIVFALGAAGLLLSPESAAALDKALEDLTGARLSLWEEEQENVRLREERAETNTALSLAVEDCAALKLRVAELEAAKRPAILDLPPGRVTRRALAQMATEDPHDSPLYHSYRVARDLPGGGSQ